MRYLEVGLSVCFTLLSCALIASPSKVQNDSPVHNIIDFGAVPDTNILSTRAIQAAIDTCFFQGGGTVRFPVGSFKSGTIVIKENVRLLFEQGSTLYASRNIGDYRAPLEDAVRPVLIYANGAKNISIEGKGTINGRAKRKYEPLKKTDAFIANITENARKAGVEMKQYYVTRPDISLVVLINCSNVRISNISLMESSFWTLIIGRSKHVLIEGLTVISDQEKGVNADGIDIVSCQNVQIKDCQVTTGDDAIVLKTWSGQPCENIEVSNCTVSSSSTGLKIGTESHEDFRNIRFTNCKVQNSNRGLSIVVRNGGTVENVEFSNIDISCSRRHFNWWGNADPIWVYLTKKSPASKVGLIKGVIFENIQARGMGTSKFESTEKVAIEDVSLINVQLHMQSENYIDKRTDHAIYAHNVNSLRLTNVSITWDDHMVEEKWQNALNFSDGEDLHITNFTARQGLKNSKDAVIVLNNATKARINNCRADDFSNTLVYVSGQKSQDIALANLDPEKKSKKPLEISSDVTKPETIRVEKK